MLDFDEEPDGALDRHCRAAVREYRLDAFDNIDVTTLLAKVELSRDDANWIAQHLMTHARSLAGYEAGQKLLARVADAR